MADKVEILDIPDTEYFVRPSLDQSQLKKFLKNPADWAYERLYGSHKTTPAMEFGTAFHAFLLGTSEVVSLPEGESFRSRANQEWKDGEEAAGHIVVSYDSMQLLERMKRNIELASKRDGLPDYMSLIEQGACEQVIEWTDTATGLRLKAKPDLIPAGTDYLVDLKTAVSADQTQFARSAIDHGYHIQAEFYRQAVAKCPAKAFKRGAKVPTAMQFWVFEKENACDWQPFSISSDSEVAELARDSIRQALIGIKRMVELAENAGIGNDVDAAAQWCICSGYGFGKLSDGDLVRGGYDKNPKELQFEDWALRKAILTV